ncbi:transcription elongation factor Spt5 [Candidatus Micrarchaeota archaeon]|nr:transcription elongation factor Spt5 [Candidatus Micrarchaeota archaeon]
MLFAYRVTAGQESIVADMLYEKIKKTKAPINALIISPNLKGYIITESKSEQEAKNIITNVPHVKGVLHKGMKLEDIQELLKSKPVEITLEKGDLVEISSGPFKGERAKVVKINKDKEDVTVELVEVAVPIPVTIKLNTIKILPK